MPMSVSLQLVPVLFIMDGFAAVFFFFQNVEMFLSTCLPVLSMYVPP